MASKYHRIDRYAESGSDPPEQLPDRQDSRFQQLTTHLQERLGSSKDGQTYTNQPTMQVNKNDNITL